MASAHDMMTNRSAWIGVMNQGPVLSTTSVFRLEHLIRTRPAAVVSRQPKVQVGDPAPDFDIESTTGDRFRVADFRGKPVVMRLTRAVTDRIV